MTGEIKQKRIRIGLFFKASEAAGFSAMAGIHIRTEDQSIGIRLHRAQLRYPLGRLPVLNRRVAIIAGCRIIGRVMPGKREDSHRLLWADYSDSSG